MTNVQTRIFAWLLFCWLGKGLEHSCWGDGKEYNPARCCSRNPPLGDPACWMGSLTFDFCCSRWIMNPRPAPQPIATAELRKELRTCLHSGWTATAEECSTSAYAPFESRPLGRLLWCAVTLTGADRVLDLFLGSGCSAATAAAAISAGSGGTVIGFDDLFSDRAQAARRALPGLRRLVARTPFQLSNAGWRVASGHSVGIRSGKLALWAIHGAMRPNGTDCNACRREWDLECPERCSYAFGPIEAVCEGLGGLDLVFFDSDGSAADGWLIEWLTIERACAPRLVLLVNLSLPNHGAWIRERLLGLGYREVWSQRTVLYHEPYSTMAFSDVRRVRSWALLAYDPGAEVEIVE